MTPYHLVLFDADRIKDYVFATGRLKEIRGASEQVRQLTDSSSLQETFGLPQWKPDPSATGIIYASGGAGAVLFDDATKAQEFCDKLEQHYWQTTRSATLSAVWVPVDGSPAQAQQQAAWKLARRKASKPHAEAIPGGGAVRFGSSMRLYPANSRPVFEPDSSEGSLVSEAAARKRVKSREYRQSLERSEVWLAFKQYLQSSEVDDTKLAEWSNAINDSQDLGSIGAQSRPRGYVALIYADGDGIGQLVPQMVDHYGLQGYKKFSEALSYAANHATARALANAYRNRPPHLLPARRERVLPFEIVTIGGDDIILLCTAEHGLAIACDIGMCFGDLVAEYLASADTNEQPLALPPQNDGTEQRVSISVGVIIAHDSVPIVQLEQRGRDLLRSAKQARGNGKGGIDFHIVSTPGLDQIGRIRSGEYAPTPDVRLTLRPYHLSQMQELVVSARRLRGFVDKASDSPAVLSGSKQADLLAACYASRPQAVLNVLTLLSRTPPQARTEIIDALSTLQSTAMFPFTDAKQDTEGKHRTALVDLLEVVDFVAAEGSW